MLPAQSLGWLLGHHAQCPSPSPDPAPSPSSFPNPSLTCRDIQRAKLTCHSTGTPGIRGAPWSSARGSPAGLPAVPPDSLTARSPGRVCRCLASGSPQGRHPAPAVCDWGTARDGEDMGKSASPWGRQGWWGQAGLVGPAWPGVRSQEGGRMKNADRVDLQGKWKRKTRQRGKSVCSEMEERQGTLSAKGLGSWRPNPDRRS